MCKVGAKNVDSRTSQNCVLVACKFLERYDSESKTFLDSIVIGDETWMCHYTPESKKAVSIVAPYAFTINRKLNVQFSERKIVVSIFWDRKEILFVNFSP